MQYNQDHIGNVLIVDDETPFILSLTTGLKTTLSKYNILSAKNGRQAIEILESEPVDLVLTDLRMPEMDGFELLAYMSTNFPSIPAIVMSAFGTQEIKQRLRSMGTLGFLEKPLDFQELTNAISKGLRQEGQEGQEGSLNGISIPSFLQLIEMEEKTCLLEIHEKGKPEKGLFYFNRGVLYDAICGKLKGENAALEIIKWEDSEIRLKDLPKKKIVKQINTELIQLIMEAMRLKDELTSAQDDDLTKIEGVIEDLVDGIDYASVNGLGDPEEIHQEKHQTIKREKEATMNIQKLNAAVELLKSDLGDALLAADIFGSEDGQSIAGYNPQPKASALFARLTKFLGKSLQDSDFPGLGRYYMLDLVGAKMVIIIPLGDYQWGMLVDSNKGQLGLLMNVVIPKVIDAFEAAITG